jgi:hypothetical protein
MPQNDVRIVSGQPSIDEVLAIVEALRLQRQSHGGEGDVLAKDRVQWRPKSAETWLPRTTGDLSRSGALST